MKNIKPIAHSLTRATLVVAVAGLALLANRAVAQEKGAERLLNQQHLNAPAGMPTADASHLSCPKCQDKAVTVVENTGKAAHPREIKTVLRHECPGCNTKIVTVGTGKQAQDQVVHTCKNGGSEKANCCATKKSALSTQGLEQK